LSPKLPIFSPSVEPKHYQSRHHATHGDCQNAEDDLRCAHRRLNDTTDPIPVQIPSLINAATASV